MGGRIGEKLHKCWLPAGAAAVLFLAVPFLLLGGESIFVYHDQLDGELIAYILQAKHLFDGNLPEFMNGASKTALIMPAPALVLLFLGGHPLAALVAMQLGGSLCGFLGMYLLAREGGAREWLAAAAGVLYAYLPFLPVYGLAQYGLPLLLWCMLRLRAGKNRKLALCYTLVYGLCSSLVLVGFGCLGVLAVWVLAELVGTRVTKFSRKTLLPWKTKFPRETKTPSSWKLLGAAWILLFLVYLGENGSLIRQFLDPGVHDVSHKEEYVLVAEPFWSGFQKAFLYGGQHSEDYHLAVLGLVCAALGAALGVRLWSAEGLKREEKRLVGWILTALGCNVCFALIAALWDSRAGVALKRGLKALGAFQADRVLWMAPCLWYLLLVCSAVLLWKLAGRAGKRVPARGLCTVALGAVLGLTGMQVLLHSCLKPNLQKLANEDYRAFSFNDYYGVGVMEQVADYLYETTGEEPSQYRVASLGIDPAAALYHGFYCLDGYSNNYSLEYKHAFREIIAPELEKSEYLRDYFDHWGNRCYLFSAECPAYYTIEKGGFYFQDYELDVEALRKLGGKYLLSAAYIQNASEQGLELLREEPFETEGSYYRIFLYGLGG